MHAVLVDTSIWVDHFYKGEPLLQDLLSSGQVVTHPFIIGELACGSLTNRSEILTLLAELPTVTIASNDEVMHLIEKNKLSGKGLGWIDAHLLASALLDRVLLWTRDKNLAVAAKKLDIKGTK
jgi:predicted nucleic acid-binding protein